MPCQHEEQPLEEDDGSIWWICGKCHEVTGYTPVTESPENLEGMHFEFYPVAAKDPWTEH